MAGLILCGYMSQRSHLAFFSEKKQQKAISETFGSGGRPGPDGATNPINGDASRRLSPPHGGKGVNEANFSQLHCMPAHEAPRGPCRRVSRDGTGTTCQPSTPDPDPAASLTIFHFTLRTRAAERMRTCVTVSVEA